MMLLYMHPVRLEWIGTATIEVAARARIRAQIVLSNVVHDKNPIVREQCLFAAYGTYLTSK